MIDIGALPVWLVEDITLTEELVGNEKVLRELDDVYGTLVAVLLGINTFTGVSEITDGIDEDELLATTLELLPDELLPNELETLEVAGDGATVEELYISVLEDELSPGMLDMLDMLDASVVAELPGSLADAVEGELDVPDRLDEEIPRILGEIIDDPVLEDALLVETLEVDDAAVADEVEDMLEERPGEVVDAELAEAGGTVLDVWLEIGDVLKIELVPEFDALVLDGWVLEVGTLATEDVPEELVDVEGDTCEDVAPEFDVLELDSGVEDVVAIGTEDVTVALVDEEEATCEEVGLENALEVCPFEVEDVLDDGL